MKFLSKNSTVLLAVFFCLFLNAGLFAQSTPSCTTKSKEATAKTACCSSAKKEVVEKTSGCTPSNCRGAKTKFGEAKVISDLRTDLIALKADMEKSNAPKFDERSYDIHGIIGETDEESLDILVKEVQIMEAAFATTLNYSPASFELPESKAKQVQYLNARLNALKELI